MFLPLMWKARPPTELKSEVISRMPNSVVEWSLTDAVRFELHGQRIKIRLAHLRGPPQPRVREYELLKLIGSKGDVLRFVRCQFHILLELDRLDLRL